MSHVRFIFQGDLESPDPDAIHTLIHSLKENRDGLKAVMEKLGMKNVHYSREIDPVDVPVKVRKSRTVAAAPTPAPQKRAAE